MSQIIKLTVAFTFTADRMPVAFAHDLRDEMLTLARSKGYPVTGSAQIRMSNRPKQSQNATVSQRHE